MEATIYNASSSSKCSWSSSNGKVASISTTGNTYARVLAEGPGTATIRVALNNGKYAECKVEVSPLNFDLNEDGISYSIRCGDYAIPKEFKIPSYFNNLPVTKIETCAFYGRDDVVSIELPSTLIEIGDGSFEDCQNLKDLIFPPSLLKVGDGAFRFCKSLNKVSIPSNVKSIKSLAFSGCQNLGEFIIEDSCDPIEFIGVNFYGTPIKELYIGRNIIWNDISTRVIRFPELEILYLSGQVTHVDDYMFWHAEKLKKAIVTAPIDSIGEEAFAECINLETMVFPDALKYIGIRAFYKCKSLKNIELHNGLESIDVAAFNFSGLTEITLPNSLVEINRHAFLSCSALKSIVIPSSVSYFGSQCFYLCENIEHIRYNTSIPLESDYQLFSSGIYTSCKLILDKGGLANALITSPWKYFVHIEEELSIDAIESIKEDELSVQVKIYSLTGMLLTDKIEQLPHGIYIIIDGSKVMKYKK